MNTMPYPHDEDDPAGRGRLSVGDPVLRKTRLLTRECATCIFRPGNPMHLAPGRLRQLVTEARADAGYIICHSTLPYAGSPIPPAICRGFADRYRTWQLQVIERLWGFVEIPPPDPASPPTDVPGVPRPPHSSTGATPMKEIPRVAGIDDFLRRQEQLIDTVGWAVMHVLPTDADPDTTTSFAYTVGLTAHDYPELLIAGLPPEVAHALLNDLASRVYDKAERFTHGQRVSDLIAGYDAAIVEGPPNDDLLPGAAIARYGRDRIRLQQVVWPDLEGRFPWDGGYDFAPHVQPLIAQP